MLTDPTFDAGNATTKDILKRYQELQGRPAAAPGDVREVYNRQDMTSRPPPRRVDTDPSLWQQESSVRPVQAPPLPHTNSGSSTPSGGAWRREDAAYGKLERSDSQLAPPEQEGGGGTPREWRNSGFYGGSVAMGHN